MRASLFRVCVSSFLIGVLLSPPTGATCGGGGGGGLGGVAPGGGAPEVYRVAWKVLPKGDALPKSSEASLVVLWYPVSASAARKSPLMTSRTLALAGSRCVADVIVPSDHTALYESFQVASGQETVVFASADGAEIGRVVADAKGRLNSGAVEKLVSAELAAREKKLEAQLKAAEKLAKTDASAAIVELQAVWSARCLFPNHGKRAAKALAKLGVKVDAAALRDLGPEALADPDVRGQHAATVEPLLRDGLTAELAGNYELARLLYRQAVQRDPADATALRLLAELYRHHTGEWDDAKELFARVLAQPSDPLARAVALHGLGKMTIHGGQNDAGLALLERSLAEFPLAITYRNLAVFWFSEQQTERAASYMREAIALEPDDRYNQIFAAVYLAVAGKHDEAAHIARANESVMEASYNLAAIWAQVGDRAKAMQLLRRHFYDYERYDAVRMREMEEARSDFVFVAIKDDPQFRELTKLAQRDAM